MKKMSRVTILVLLVAAVILAFTVTSLVYAQADRNSSTGVQGLDGIEQPYPNPCLEPYPGPYECDFLPSILNFTETLGALFGE